MTLRGRLGKLEAQARAESGDDLGVYRADTERGVWVECQTGAERPMTELEQAQVHEEQADGNGLMFLGAGGYIKIIYGIDPEEL